MNTVPLRNRCLVIFAALVSLFDSCVSRAVVFIKTETPTVRCHEMVVSYYSVFLVPCVPLCSIGSMFHVKKL